MYAKSVDDLVYLVSSLLNDTHPDAERVASIDLKELYALAGAHTLRGLTAFALEHAGIHDPAFTAAKGQAIRKVVLLSLEREKVTAELETTGIWYMPLKGSVLKDYYPAVGMRESSDCDILFDASRAADVKDIMKGLGFTVEEYGMFHHDMYFKPPVSNFEMHKKLIALERYGKCYAYYADVKSRLLKDEGNDYGYHFSLEDFYIYMIVHEYVHYSEGGTGLRSLVDAYVYVKKFGEVMDWEYISRELEALELSDFEGRNRGLALRLFGGQDLTDEDCEMLKYIAGSGTYGSAEQAVMNRLKAHPQSGLKYILSRIFLPMDEIRDKYPFVYKHKCLILFLPFHRIIRAVKRRRIALGEIRAVMKHKTSR